MNFIERLKKNVEQDDQKIKRAYEAAGNYAEFIVVIEQGQLIANRELEINDQLSALGCYTSRGKTYQKRRAPYMAVDGRVKMMVDEHRKEGAKFKFTQEIDWDHNVLTVIWESDLYGKTIGTAKIGFDGTGADATNPVENAQTSAVGRALGQAGYGLFGTGIASAEEVMWAINERSRQEEGDQDGQSTANRTAPSRSNVTSIRRSEEGQASGTMAQSIGQKYDPNEVKRLIAIKSRMGIKNNAELNPYVEEFVKQKMEEAQALPDGEEKQAKIEAFSRVKDYSNLAGNILAEFNDFMEQKVPKAG